ncbi:Bug family tripartite tricarboxylate transporter substrate binding protein [Chachezhania antarctica]|uniref:Bug family tripartite tricarboxylate transporter substrate binding protein n=1 Tax=Chachezhania antarctica TaxID=2340860 RepID=UPI000EAF72C1|nr:tripartite tricarboxylate transporter substrate binding protein [Chachezhania antarctica]|tara:strand:- start:1044 stop:2012 length:969 start_codon:yes stop_codon:yes gene_type:complete
MNKLISSGLALSLAVAAAPALAQNFPSQPIQMNVCSPAGGGNDQNAQAIAPFVEKYLGQPAIVQYKPGAGGTLAATEVSEADPDGYTLLVCDPGGTVFGPIAQNLDFGADSLVPIAQLTFVPWVLTAAGEAPWDSAQAFVDDALARPGEIDAAIADVASADHYMWLLFAQDTGIGPSGLRWVPYGGGGPKVRAMLAGESMIDMLLPSLVKGPMVEGTMKPLAVAAGARSAAIPDVPTMKELGIDVVDGLAIHVFAPAGTPDDIMAKLRAGFAEIATDPDYVDVYTKMGQDISGFMDGNAYQPVWEQTWAVAPDLLREAAGAK